MNPSYNLSLTIPEAAWEKRGTIFSQFTKYDKTKGMA